MEQIMVTIQGQKIVPNVEEVKYLLSNNPSWGRTRLSEELCRRWNWRTPNGRFKDMACRTLLLKLERAGHIKLPERKRKSTNQYRNRCISEIPHSTEQICCNLKELLPLNIVLVSQDSHEHVLFKYLLAKYHYLSLRNTVGENIKYLVRDRNGRPLACLLFGSAAWQSAPRDKFIHWDRQAREASLGFITNNTRFLILPWIKVSHLASHILATIAKRISSDWLQKYGHPVYLLETFVDKSRYRGTCYRAANWILTGQTKGRTRNDRNHKIKTSVKDVYLYPLTKKYRSRLRTLS